MALIGINAHVSKQRDLSKMEQIMMGIEIASKTLGTALQVPEYLQKKKALKAEAEKTGAETDLIKAQNAPIGEGERQWFISHGVPDGMVPSNRAQADKLFGQVYESPTERASRLRSEAIISNTSRQQKREDEKWERESSKPVLTPAEEAVDKKFGSEYADWDALGGYTVAEKNMKQARWALAKLKSAHKDGKNYSGKGVGLLEGKAKGLLAPEAADMEEQVTQTMVMNLRQAFGPQFTEQEGRRLMRMTFNPMLDEEVNARRLEGLVEQLDRQFEAKRSASEYYKQYGTLKGWHGSFVSPASLFPSPNKDDAENF